MREHMLQQTVYLRCWLCVCLCNQARQVSSCIRAECSHHMFVIHECVVCVCPTATAARRIRPRAKLPGARFRVKEVRSLDPVKFHQSLQSRQKIQIIPRIEPGWHERSLALGRHCRVFFRFPLCSNFATYIAVLSQRHIRVRPGLKNQHIAMCRQTGRSNKLLSATGQYPPLPVRGRSLPVY